MLSLQRESQGWCLHEGLHGPGGQAFPAELDQALAPQVHANPCWHSVTLKRGVSQLSSIARLLLMNARCCVTFLLLNYVLLGLVRSVVSLSVCPRRSQARQQVLGGVIALLWRCCQYQGMQSPALSWGTRGSCYQIDVLVSPTEHPSPSTAFPPGSDTPPLLRSQRLPKEFACLGPKRFVEEKMG